MSGSVLPPEYRARIEDDQRLSIDLVAENRGLSLEGDGEQAEEGVG